MRQHPEGQDQVFPNDSRFAPVRAVAARWAETFQRPKVVNLPKGIMMRRGDNWRVLIAIGDALGYGATLRAAAVAVEAANFDPQLRNYEDLHGIFQQRQEAGLWEDDILQALADIEHGYLELADQSHVSRSALSGRDREKDGLERCRRRQAEIEQGLSV